MDIKASVFFSDFFLDICMYLIQALFTIAKTSKQPHCPSVDSALRRCGVYTHTHTQYYSAVTKNEILPFAAIWVDLENIMLSEIRDK